jgi:hypothetical protein
MANSWQELSKEISEVIAQVGRSICRCGCEVGTHIQRHRLAFRFRFNRGSRDSGRSRDSSHQRTGADGASALSGIDRGTDTAVLKLDAGIQAPPAQFGSAAALAVGEFTVAVGRTRRGNIVASSGIVSGLMSEWRVARTLIDQFIRPDVELYPGFSGGALVNSDGAVGG